jgi:hypothetical protein
MPGIDAWQNFGEIDEQLAVRKWLRIVPVELDPTVPEARYHQMSAYGS